MPNKQTPFFGINYEWEYGEDNWNVGMDANLQTLAYLGNKVIKGFVAELPTTPIEGDAYVLTVDNYIYQSNNAVWHTIIPVKDMEILDTLLNKKYVFDGTSWAEKVESESFLKIAFIGDSLTQQSSRNESWATQTTNLLEQLTGKTVIGKNVAIGGSDWYSCQYVNQHSGATKTQVQEVIEFAPNVVFVALGINDMVYGENYTSAQVITNATTLRDTIKAALPDCKIVYAEEVPHDLTKGVSPVSLQNQDVLPNSHTTITLNGLSGVRVNSTSYLTTPVSAGFLSRHQNWGNATTSIRTLFDGYFSADLWKMARLGCMVDSLHIDELGHCLWAWSAVGYLATSGLVVNGVDLTKLNFSNLSSPILNIDLLYTEFNNKTLAGNMPAMYRGYSSFKRAEGWMLKSPSGVMDVVSTTGDAKVPLTVRIDNVTPDATVYVAVDSDSFADTARVTRAQGTHLQTFIPADIPIFAAYKVAGAHTLSYAVQNPDGSYDAFTTGVQVSSNYVANGSTILKYTTSNISVPEGTLVYLDISAVDHDDLSIAAHTSRITIPSSLNGKKIRLNANVRMTIPVTTSDTTTVVFAGIQKNRQAASGNSIASGRGLPSSWQTWNSTGVSGTITADLNLAGAVITAVTGDYYEVSALIDKSSTTAGTVLANSYTWFELEVVG